MLLAVLVAAVGAGLAAQESAVREAPRLTGRVLLLHSERGMEGEIEKIGEQYRIRRGSGEAWVPADKAMRLCADWEDAYAYMKTRANLGDPDERLRLVRWCQLNSLREQALLEAKLALEMRPGHHESQQLVTLLTRAVAGSPSTAANAGPLMPGRKPQTSVSSDVSADSFALFATRVQPVLMNTCVNCHSNGRGGEFQLLRTEGNHRNSTQANLEAVLAQVNIDNPILSPLLVKAVSRHGNASDAPLKNKQSVPYKNMQAWIDHLIAGNPHLRVHASMAAGAKGKVEPAAFAQAQTVTPTNTKPAVPAREMAKPLPLPSLPDATPLAPPTKKEQAPPAPEVNQRPEAQVNPLDPFDPALFNRQVK